MSWDTCRRPIPTAAPLSSDRRTHFLHLLVESVKLLGNVSYISFFAKIEFEARRKSSVQDGIGK
jgi:hypothetical protein